MSSDLSPASGALTFVSHGTQFVFGFLVPDIAGAGKTEATYEVFYSRPIDLANKKNEPLKYIGNWISGISGLVD